MGKSTFLTPVYIFSSIRAGSGKATMLANLAVHLNNLNHRVAVVDLDADYPQKLLNSFPSAINLHEYTELALLKEKSDSRYQKNFYFTDTSQISYFPATRLKEPSLLFSDTIFRDFLLQARASFDLLLLNFPSGPSHCEKVSEIIGRTFLWRGSKPASVIVSLSDERSLVHLDKIIQRNTALSYQLQENTLLLFNKVPSSPDDQNLSDSILSSIELRRLFNFSNSYIVSANEEFPHQRITSVPGVLNPETYIHQTISSLSRLLARLGNETNPEFSEKSNNFGPVLDGELLEKLSPYLSKIQRSVSRTLLMGKGEVQLFLEENAGAFRIRLRTSSLNSGLRTIQTNVPVEIKQKPVVRESPLEFSFSTNRSAPVTCELATRIKNPVISFNPVFHFDDRFAWKTSIDNIILKTAFPNKSPCPSPIYFRAALDLQEIPSLAHVLGFTRKKYRKQQFVYPTKTYSSGGVTHFFIPPEFDLVNSFRCLFKFEEFADFSLGHDLPMIHQSSYLPAFEFPDTAINDMSELPDIFSRDNPFIPENDFLLREKPDLPASFSMALRFSKMFKIQPSQQTKLRLSAADFPVKSISEPESTGLLAQDFPPDCLISQKLHLTYNKQILKAAAPQFKNNCIPKVFINFCHKHETAKIKVCKVNTFSPAIADNEICNDTISENIFYQLPFKYKNFPEKICSSIANSQPPVFCDSNRASLKKALNISDQLLDHKFKYFEACDFPSRSFAYKNITKQNISFDLPVFFPQNLVERPFNDIPDKASLPEALVKQIFQVFITGFKPFEHRFKSSHERHAYSIFPSNLTLANDPGYRTSSEKFIYNANRLLDKFMAENQFKLLNRGPVPCHTENFPDSFARFVLNTIVPDLKINLPETVKNQVFSNAVNRHDSFKFFVQALSWEINNQTASKITVGPSIEIMNWRTAFSSPDFYYQESHLSTIPVRSVLRTFNVFCPPPAMVIINLTIDQIKETFTHKDLNVKSFNTTLEFDKIHIPRTIPMRVKQVETPRIESQLQNEIRTIILPQITIAAGRKHSLFSFAMPRPGKKPSMQQLMPVLRHTDLSLLKYEPPQMITSKDHDMSCIFPTALEEFFAHLLYNIRYQRQRSISYQERMQNSSYSDLTPHIYYSQQDQPTLQFYDRQAQGNKKIKKDFNRFAFVVSKLKLRDLMNFARQANEKLASLNTRIQT